MAMNISAPGFVISTRSLQTWLGVVVAFFLLNHRVTAAPAYFAYISDKRIITVEPTSTQELILNVINLSDEVLVVRAYDVVVQSDSTKGVGQVYRKEGKGSADSYFATQLLKPREFAGLTVVGRLVPAPDKVVFRSGSRFFFLQKLAKRDFDTLERQISEIDLKVESAEKALKEVGIFQGYGRLVEYPEGETEELEQLLPKPGDPLPPRVLEKKEPKSFAAAPAGTEVQIKGLVSGRGELLDASVLTAPNPEAGERALAVVRNSWKFVPAVQDGEVVSATVTLKVIFAE